MINIVKRYLEKSNYTSQREDFGVFFLSHPNYPSVLAITDSLDSLSIPNETIKIPKEQFVELPETFLTLFNQVMVLVQKKDSYVVLEFENGIRKNVSFNDFLSDWDQIVIVIEPNEVIDIKKERMDTKWLRYTLPLVLFVVLSLIYNEFNIGSLTLLLTSIIGLTISVFILREKFGLTNAAVVSKICAMTPNTSCSSVIQSDNGKKRIHFSDLPFLFFGISVMAIAMQPYNSAVIVGLLSVFSLPIVLYSIWVQKVEFKKWCVLCLAVSFIVGIQVLIFVFENQSFPPVFSIRFFEFSLFALFFATIWMAVKPIFEANLMADKEAVESIKFKRNYALFNFLSQELPLVEGFNQLKGLTFGSKKAEVRLTLVISPSCGLCHKAFEEAFNLVERFPKRVYLNVLFNINPENDDNPYRMVVEQLFAISNSFPQKTMEAMSDWYISKMKFLEWKSKWAGNIVDVKAKHQIRQQYNWCLENEFNYTPIKIVNGKLFPEGYEISDLKYFLNDFSQEKEERNKSILARA